MPSIGYYALLGAFIVMWLSVGYWVTADADARGARTPWLWGGLALFFFPLLLYYLLVYRRRYDRKRPASGVERGAGTVALASTVAMVVAVFLGPPDPYTQALWWAGAAAFLLIPSTLLVYRDGYGRLASGGGN
ncbi:hypothetical protein HUG10_02015 [Halorarum halophilum]|uniref:Transmembrane protein n=1 Tax=Halorarum halophilum TaxID=2743090 RepID=A0A7D5GDS5_9EURY|nr:hypothetical protein [Halobaculum halophilum]QLG26390.1 hypothetical protein HUG10_02015 [Halobaculum halophilum]